jgi:Type IV secretory pathway, VirD4 components
MPTQDLIVSSLPDDDRRLSYTFMGRRLYAWNAPLYVHDVVRSRPALVLGSTGFGKSEFMLSLAFSDASKKRPVFFLDGKCDMRTLNKLYFYAKQAQRPFMTLMPFQDGDRHTASWNPFVSSILPISVITEAFVNAYSDPKRALNRNDPSGSGYYIEMQRAVCGNLIRALHSTGYQYCINDLRYLLDNIDILERVIQPILRPDGHQPYGEVMRLRKEEPDEFPRIIRRFTNYLGQFRHWAINSYNPGFTIERAIDMAAVVYIGLPVDSQPVEMAAIGNMLINLLRATSSHLQTKGIPLQRPVSCIADEAGAFIDSGLAEWICKVRSTGFMLTLGVQTLSQLEGRYEGFGSEVRANSPNIMIYNPRDAQTADWFSKLVGNEARYSITATRKEDEETGDGTVKLYEAPKVHRDAILSLAPGQFFYNPALSTDHPPLLAAPMLPSPDSRNPAIAYRRTNVFPEARRKGLYLSAILHNRRFGAGVGAGSARR